MALTPREGPTDERHVCSVCLELLCRPVQPPCGHVYCQHCIRRAVLAQQRSGRAVTCPLCRAGFSPSALAPSTDVEREIGHTFADKAAKRLTATENEARTVDAIWAAQHARCTWRQLAVSALLVVSFIAVIDFTHPPPPTFPQRPEGFVANLDARQRKQLKSSRPTLPAQVRATGSCQLRATSGGVWWTQPEDAPQQWATVGQLTVPTNSAWRLIVNLQGRRPLWLSDGTTIGTGCQECAGPDEDWVEREVVFSSGSRYNTRNYLHVVPAVRRVAVDGIAGHETLRLEVTLNPSALNVYAFVSPFFRARARMRAYVCARMPWTVMSMIT